MHRQFELLEIFNAHREGLLRYALRLTRDRSDAEDVVQEAWLRFSRSAEERPAAEPVGYLHRIVRNLALDGLRRKGLETRIFDDGDGETSQLVDSSVDPEAVTAARHELALVQQALNAMPDRMRIAVEMHRVEGAKLREIADRLSISVTTAHELVAAGIERCRAALRGGGA